MMQRSFKNTEFKENTITDPASTSIPTPSTKSKITPISTHDLSGNKTEDADTVQQNRKDQNQPSWKVVKFLTVLFLASTGAITGLVVQFSETGDITSKLSGNKTTQKLSNPLQQNTTLVLMAQTETSSATEVTITTQDDSDPAYVPTVSVDVQDDIAGVSENSNDDKLDEDY